MPLSGGIVAYLYYPLSRLRWDYLTKSWWNMTEMAGDRLKAFQWIQQHGATLGQVVPVFPPYDLPVWTSLATGLYPRATGVVGDHMFNLKSRELFSTEDPEASLENWWTGGEPIWSLAAKHGRRVNQHFSFLNLIFFHFFFNIFFLISSL